MALCPEPEDDEWCFLIFDFFVCIVVVVSIVLLFNCLLSNPDRHINTEYQSNQTKRNIMDEVQS